MKDSDNLKIAITHDYLTEYGGAEMVLWEILKTFPSAHLYTPIIRPTSKQRAFWLELEKHKIHTSFLSSLPLTRLIFKLLLPLQIRFFKHLDLSDYDVVISSSAGFAKFIKTGGGTKHVAYIHTPPRFLWGYETSSFHKIPSILRFLVKPLLSKWRKQDKQYAKSADLLVTNSKNIQKKIKQVYKRESKVIYPPVNTKGLIEDKPTKKDDFFLTIGRLYPYKKIDLIVRAFKQTKQKLVVIGDGAQRKQLEKISGENIQIKGFVDEEVKIDLLRRAKGFIFAAEEDFGIVMVEALASGTPVIAFKKGGASEIIQDGKNGILFNEQTENSIVKALDEFARKKFDTNVIKESSRKFSAKNFREQFMKLILGL